MCYEIEGIDVKIDDIDEALIFFVKYPLSTPLTPEGQANFKSNEGAKLPVFGWFFLDIYPAQFSEINEVRNLTSIF
jgi:hypothetical protein